MRGNIWCRGISRRCANNFRKWSNFSRGGRLAVYKLRCEIAPFCPHFAPLYRPISSSVLILSAPAALICRLSPPAVPSKLYILSLFAPVGVRKYGENTLRYLHFVAFGRFGIPPPLRFRQAPRVSPPKFAVFQASKIRDNSNHRNSG